MLYVGIVEHVEESEWISPIVIQDKKTTGEVGICVSVRKMNDACLNDPFPTPFRYEVLESVVGQEMYSFTDNFSRYHQVRIAKEDCHKMTFVIEWGCYEYMVMPFGLKNTPAIFSRVVVSAFKDFIHKFLEVYFDDWTILRVKDHIESMCMMLGHFCQYQILLNSKKCIFFTPFGVLLGHIVCRDGILVDPTKVVIILELPPPTSVTQLKLVLRHIGYYEKFIRGYAEITIAMEKLLKKDAKF